MNPNEYAEEIVNEFVREITDNLFLFIEQDEERMRKYMTNANRFELDALNKAIGLKIKEMLDLENTDISRKPKSKLLKTYTQHKIK